MVIILLHVNLGCEQLRKWICKVEDYQIIGIQSDTIGFFQVYPPLTVWLANMGCTAYRDLPFTGSTITLKRHDKLGIGSTLLLTHFRVMEFNRDIIFISYLLPSPTLPHLLWAAPIPNPSSPVMSWGHASRYNTNIHKHFVDLREGGGETKVIQGRILVKSPPPPWQSTPLVWNWIIQRTE